MLDIATPYPPPASGPMPQVGKHEFRGLLDAATHEGGACASVLARVSLGKDLQTLP